MITQNKPTNILISIAKAIVSLEPILILIMVIAFWQPSPNRDSWLFLLWGVPIIFAARYVAYGRVWTRFMLDIPLLVFIGISVLDLLASGMTVPPFRRSQNLPFSWVVLMGRVLMGMAICVYAAEYARLRLRINGLLWAVLILGLGIAALALTATEWNSKSNQLRLIIDVFPRFTGLGTFNANEIGGVLAWTAPLLAGLIGYKMDGRSGQIFRVLCGIGFGATLLALVLGQSRFALAGSLLALALMILLLIQQWRWRLVAWGGIALLIVFEIMIIRNVFSPTTLDRQIDRDELSASLRLGIWEAAVESVQDLPLTGVGLNQFRDRRVRALYPVPGYETRVLPHVHNELLQIATDMGIPGLLAYIAWYLVIIYMLFRCFRTENRHLQVLAVAVGGGLLAHNIFGLGDAIPIWDRFAFVGWIIIALACATDTLRKHLPNPDGT